MIKIILYSLIGGIFYIKTMFKMGIYEPIDPQKRSNIVLKIVGYALMAAALLSLCKGIMAEPSQPLETIMFFESASILCGVAVYCFNYKKSNSTVKWKALKILYALLLTLAYLGWEETLLSIPVYCILLFCVYWRFSFKKKQQPQETPSIDLDELKNKKIDNSSPYLKQGQKEITGDSKFSNYCEKSQDGSNGLLINKPVWIIYLIWAISNLYLLTGAKDDYYIKYFFPFTSDQWDNGYYKTYQYSWDKNFYDFSEFFVYVFILPAILFVVYRRYNEIIDKFVNKLLNKK